MLDTSTPLSKVFDGWEGYNTSIMHSLQPLIQAQLDWRPAEKLRSVGELTSHIALGRLGWFIRLQAPGSAELFQEAMDLGWESAIASKKDEIIRWLDATWRMIGYSLSQWTLSDLWRTFEQEYQGVKYKVSYQWVIWRVLAHDMHHGGELAVMLGMQDIAIPELGDLGGHITVPPVDPRL
jgi:uncharacterized damage-inducible protein DinB